MKQSVKMIVGNWKMNGLGSALVEAEAIGEAAGAVDGACRVALCPPATLVARMAQALEGGSASVGGQDCHAKPSGAFTGSISAVSKLGTVPTTEPSAGFVTSITRPVRLAAQPPSTMHSDRRSVGSFIRSGNRCCRMSVTRARSSITEGARYMRVNRNALIARRF